MEVSSAKGSELISFSRDEESMEDTILIAVSQSGTTTDTNRVVDMCRKRGAWVHSIVNRRNSPLVLKSHSHIYTSNGRDVEMAVASTKAFYSQVTAGAIIALILASELKTLGPEEIEKNLAALESLPQKIEAVLDRQDVIGQCAHEYAPANRYWALVGNGPNHIAAEEIRIKLSELCYKSIPCDFTEDKKHIDLSTEPPDPGGGQRSSGSGGDGYGKGNHHFQGPQRPAHCFLFGRRNPLRCHFRSRDQASAR